MPRQQRLEFFVKSAREKSLPGGCRCVSQETMKYFFWPPIVVRGVLSQSGAAGVFQPPRFCPVCLIVFRREHGITSYLVPIVPKVPGACVCSRNCQTLRTPCRRGRATAPRQFKCFWNFVADQAVFQIGTHLIIGRSFLDASCTMACTR